MTSLGVLRHDGAASSQSELQSGIRLVMKQLEQERPLDI